MDNVKIAMIIKELILLVAKNAFHINVKKEKN